MTGGPSVVLGRFVLMSCPSPSHVVHSLRDEVLMVALDLMGPIVMVFGDCECEGAMVPW